MAKNFFKLCSVFFLLWLLGCKTETDPRNFNAPITPSQSNGPGKPSPIQGVRLLPTRNGRMMAYDFRPGSRAETWLIIHGLGDDMTRIQALADRATQEGFSVLRVDLQGHGETLKEYLRTHDTLPEKLNYWDNVEDLEVVLESLHIYDLVIVGHSYGGGIAYALAADLATKPGPQVLSVHLLAPYVRRIDQFLKDHSFFPFLSSTDDSLDPYTEAALRKSFTDYFTARLSKPDSQITAEERKWIQIQVDAAILATKGILVLDLLDPSKPLPKFPGHLQILGGRQDGLVLPSQLRAFDQRLQSENVSHELSFLEGSQATHFFPQTMPDEVYQRIRNFQ